MNRTAPPRELYFHPRSRFVAEFIGETNLLAGKVHKVKGSTVVVDWYGHDLYGHAPEDAPAPGDDVSASVRLEKLAFSDSRPATENAVQGRVVGRTFLGSRVVVDLRVDAARGATLRAYVDTGTAEKVGSGTVWVGWETHAMAILSD